eukprot:gb/GECH01013614.1/.p1 GENE.gb/GECH01013614.1/~~gb/GECH01013614.1/.p1  ORF type:complete len:920 (+),score=142.77 gb/GECH01013614.1/:1-2760(+)
MGVPRAASLPIGILYFTFIAFLLALYLYILGVTVYPFRFCTNYWVYLILGVTIAFGLPPGIYFGYYGFRYVTRPFKHSGKKTDKVHSEGVNKQIERVGYVSLLILVIVLSCLLIANFGVAVHYASNSRVSRSSFSVPQLSNDARIKRVSGNIPHIKAESLTDAASALGVAHATDRLYQMDLLRRMANGTLAAAYGSEFTATDRFFRTLGLGRMARRDYGSLTGDAKDLVDRYTAGVNAYIDANDPSPFEKMIAGFDIPAWEPSDSLAVMKILQWRWSGSMHREMLRYTMLVDRGLNTSLVQDLLPLYPSDAPTTLPLSTFEVPGPASEENIRREDNTLAADMRATDTLISGLGNGAPGEVPQADTVDDLIRNWDLSLNIFHNRPQASSALLITGQLTVGQYQAPKIAQSMDGAFTAPADVYPAGIRIPSMNATLFGSTVPGIPAMFNGRGASHVWSATPSWTDVQDLYVLRESDDGYTYEGETQSFETREETIEVAGSDPVTITVRETVFGPVISDVWSDAYQPGPRPLALRWTGLDGNDTSIYGFWGLATATSDEQFFQAAERIQAPPVNLLYARAGRSSYLHGGRVPLRRTTQDAREGTGHTGLYPADGTSGLRRWQGYESPRIQYDSQYNYLITTDARALPRGAPVFLGYEQGWSGRMERLSTLVQSNINGNLVTPITAETLSLYISDIRSTIYTWFSEVLQNLNDLSGIGTQNKELLNAWDGDMFVGSADASTFTMWVRRLGALPAIDLPVNYWTDYTFLYRAYRDGHPACRETESSCQDVAASELDELTSRPGWGTSRHEAHFDHVLFSRKNTNYDCMCSRSQTAPGDATTVAAAPGGSEEDNFDTRSGITYWQVTDLASPKNDLFLMPMGVTGVPFTNGGYDQWVARWGRLHFLRVPNVDTDDNGGQHLKSGE